MHVCIFVHVYCIQIIKKTQNICISYGTCRSEHLDPPHSTHVSKFVNSVFKAIKAFTGADKARCLWCPPVLQVAIGQVKAQTWLIWLYSVWMAKDATWRSAVPLWVWKCTWWLLGSFQGKLENWTCITLIQSWCCTKCCESKALLALPPSLALMFP